MLGRAGLADGNPGQDYWGASASRVGWFPSLPWHPERVRSRRTHRRNPGRYGLTLIPA